MSRECVRCETRVDDAVRTCPKCFGEVFRPAGDGSAGPAGGSAGTEEKPSGGRGGPDAGAYALRLDFEPGWSVELRNGGEVRLGRDPAWSRYATALSEYPQVSRRHAVVGVGPRGDGWIRDRRSLNGTFHNGTRIVAGTPHPLADGDTITLSTRLVAHVRVPVREGTR